MDSPTRRLDEAEDVDLCAKCGAATKWARVYAHRKPGPELFPVELESLDRGSIWHGHARSEVRARVCSSCGYTEFYAMKPEDL